MLKALQKDPESAAVYIAPTKSLCTERFNDWTRRLKPVFKHGKKKGANCPVVVELTGDTDLEALAAAKEARLM